MHQPASALPGALSLLQDPASQQLATQVFGQRARSRDLVLVDPFAPPAAMLNAWAFYGGGYNDPGYFRDQWGIVHLRGLIKSGALGSSAFSLPVGYRPTADSLFACVSNLAFGTLFVNAAGDVIPFNGSNVSFSLEGVTFRAA
jgi:hypothetical protein